MLNIVSTPIGNLDDLSIRQAKTLAASDIILAEDTRSAQTLLNGIKERFPDLQITDNRLPPVWSYYKEKEFQKLPEIIKLLKEEKNISLISEAGTPLVSDPGYLLVKSCIQRNLPITVIPGPSAITTALIYSGFNPQEHMFLGFFPKKESQILQLIDKLKQIKTIFPDMVFVFYESPLRIKETLRCIDLACRQAGTSKFNVEIVICREMTKKFEEIIRGPIDELIKRNYKGEITVVIK
ncbi:MAG: Ribosomal RNA small subunit methyltransferase I [Candidatus Roizmanbacteria bacterium GW2011_GWA2_33_33]|uniref:Ribosomal RNA small subunit methyltransferase I n=1 Tax=Candidatus Roizmanbacteria bacterium GW2011_GWA2_33_33 TaxID=1618476 RepID=A0A0G0CGS3_9BACT|nr:MAG: Ribosomal RNA small subunit methyltransferase I [Candidatus Roizmanbacteria bacterium GW2011_GWA2_33_33]